MGLLDSMPSSSADYIERLKLSGSMMDAIWARQEHSPLEASVMGEMRKGRSAADIVRLTKEQREAILVHGSRFFQVGEYDKAADWMLMLITLDPLEERAMYVLGMVQQVRGKLSEAAQLYVRFLALDATNPEGYLRLGECFLAAREFDNATGCFEQARSLCTRGFGTHTALQHAANMLDAVNAQSSTH